MFYFVWEWFNWFREGKGEEKGGGDGIWRQRAVRSEAEVEGMTTEGEDGTEDGTEV